MRIPGVLLLFCAAASAQDFSQSKDYFKNLKVLPPETMQPAQPAVLPDNPAKPPAADPRPCSIPLKNVLRSGGPPSRMPNVQPRGAGVSAPMDFVQVPAPPCEDWK